MPISVPTVGTSTGFNTTQSYAYDALNRLQSAEEMSGTTQGWKQSYVYDRFGNRRIDTGTDQYGKKTSDNIRPLNFDNPAVSDTNNRIAVGNGYAYDAAGNLTTTPNRFDQTKSYKYEYDAENHQVSFDRDPTGTPTEKDVIYVYDGDGQRIKKIADGVTTIFVYNIDGQLVAEYATASSGGAGTSYLTSDPLGTPRVITGSNINASDGGVKARHDYLPFGEEATLLSGRSPLHGYVVDDFRQKFTGYERESETGMDYAQARYYSSPLGRFTSTDPLMASASSGSPQSWNRYTYSYNNPLRYTDPSGMKPGDFYDVKNGEKIGTDGKKDGILYIVYDKNDVKTIQNTTGNFTGTVNSAIKIANVDVINAIGAAVINSDSPNGNDPEGGFHEVSVEWRPGANNQPVITSSTGPYSPNPLNGAHVAISTDSTTEGKGHVHPSGSRDVPVAKDPRSKTSTSGITLSGSRPTRDIFVQNPSQKDINTALPNGTNIVVGAGDKTVYFYKPSGNRTDCNCIAKMSLKNFLKVGKQK